MRTSLILLAAVLSGFLSAQALGNIADAGLLFILVPCVVAVVLDKVLLAAGWQHGKKS